MTVHSIRKMTPTNSYALAGLRKDILLSLANAIVALLTISSAAASTIIVNRTSDTVANDGRCTLREAIIAANTNTASGTVAGECVAGSAAETDTIVFSLPNINELCPTSGCVVGLQSALPDITSSMSISGPMIIRPASGTHLRVFSIRAPSQGTVTFSGLTISRANVPGSSGGAVFNDSTGTVNVNDCTISGNFATGGGGIFNSNGTMNVSHCIISNNQAEFGGGIENSEGTLNVNNSTINNNSAGTDQPSHAGGGGGIANFGGWANVTASTISSNSAIGSGTATINRSGGGILNLGAGFVGVPSGTVEVINSTITSNSALGSGGGIENEQVDSGVQSNFVHVSNSTISDNSIPGLSGGGVDSGGGIHNGRGSILTVSNSTISRNPNGGGLSNRGDIGDVVIKSSIIAQNGFGDIFGGVTSEGFNLSGDGAGFVHQPTDLAGTFGAKLDPGLDPNGLQDNGGPTKTIALLPASPAIDKGSSVGSSGTLIADQRGVGYARTVNKSVGNATGGDGTDIGAFELGAQIKAVSRKKHSVAGMFDINLPLFGPKVGVECRKGGSSRVFQLVFTFPRTVTVGSASARPDSAAVGATGSISSMSVNGKTVTVNLIGVSNAQRFHITLFDVSDGTKTNDVDIPMGVLFGDTNNNGTVADNDVSLTQSKVGQAISKTNFREDVDLTGSINSTDVNMVTSNKGKKLP